MGIKGLHGLLKSIQKPCNLKKFEGQTLGVDAYGWLHRGTVACAMDLALDRPTAKHIDFVLNRIRMLLFFGVTPYLVFDGDNLPSKSGTEADRFKKREESKKLALELHTKGRTTEAQQEFQKAVDVTPYMARQLIEELKRLKIHYVVAPYEADAQLVYLERQGIINGIISEDSDLLVFGAKRLLSKLDQYGDCIEINRGEFTACRDISLIGWTDTDFRHMCILSGCDYLPNIPKMGLKTAYRSMRKYKNVEKVLKVLQFEGNYRVPAGYAENFKQAENTFLYQRVFCPAAQKLVALTTPDYGLNLDEMPYIGADVDPEVAVGVACGDLDPMTKDAINLKPSLAPRPIPSLNRRQTVASSADLKPNKPISSFFTPRRVPLAELDPNSLAPSPSQQRLLERHANNSWLPSPANPGSGLMRSTSSASLNRLDESPIVRTTQRESFLGRAARLSTVPAVKRQRLCSDADEGILPTPSEEARSRFFGVSSDGGANVPRVKKSRKSSFGVFSDDIAEDIMSQIAESSAPADVLKSTPSKVVTDNDSQDTIATSPVQVDACTQAELDTEKTDSSQNDGEIVDEQKDSMKLGPRPVSIDTEPELFREVLEKHVKRQNASLLSKFVFSGSDKGPDVFSASAEEKRMASSRTTTPTVQAAAVCPGRSLNRGSSLHRRFTPLQRLGQNALSRSKSMDNFSVRKMLNSTSRDSGYESDFGREMQPEAVSALRNSHGSEDQIVPDSDEDAEESPQESATLKLNLQRFSFIPG
ncbi:putative exonuclease [Talaromyces proteolyticus]|uniref:Exonuclease n=1 Tax=Talaromyces proteolyticus TaxID=1131652 RepID=A0AAD4KKU8_9EURO|nr:putative exonuclease [Talaromyces proteolyticus]KAH8693942.1 putative exonuclease [Talaromyces proteolyticus]